MYIKKKNKKGFTLIELLAVIVVLAIILVIAVPKILDIIKSSRENNLISSVKLVARNAEQKKLTNEVLDDTSKIKCEEVADLNSSDYGKCTISESNGDIVVKIVGKGKFEGYTCTGTKELVTCKDSNEPVIMINVLAQDRQIKGSITKSKVKTISFYDTSNITAPNIDGLEGKNVSENGADNIMLYEVANIETPTKNDIYI